MKFLLYSLRPMIGVSIPTWLWCIIVTIHCFSFYSEHDNNMIFERNEALLKLEASAEFEDGKSCNDNNNNLFSESCVHSVFDVCSTYCTCLVLK